MNFVQTAKNVEEVKLQIDNLAKSLRPKCYSNSEIRKSAIQQDLAVITHQDQSTPEDSELRYSEGVILYIVLKQASNHRYSYWREVVDWNDGFYCFQTILCVNTERLEDEVKSVSEVALSIQP